MVDVVVVDEVDDFGPVLAGAEVVVVKPCDVVVVEPVFFEFPPLAAGVVVVVVVVVAAGAVPGSGVWSTSCAWLIAADMALRSVWNWARLSAFKSAIAAL